MTSAKYPGSDGERGEEASVGSFASAIFVTITVAFGASISDATLVLLALLMSNAAHDQWTMHHVLSAVVIALANNVDNLGARLAYSVQGTKVSGAVNAWISVITLIISAAAAYFGRSIITLVGDKVASIIAMGMLSALGLWMILHARLQSWHERIHEEKTATKHAAILVKPHHADIDDSKHIDFFEGTVLGFALSINNIGGGLTAGVLGVDPLLVGVLSAAVSFTALFAGNYVADYFIQKRISDKAATIGGLALILIGVKQLF
ncbi:manganese efflux pump [Methylocystis iwaonis]|uniref:Sporulation membrane protein YtaF n=1 Tax=Methylocystis iwaonis TaxID=2885079 RepID=A0ABM8E9S1_9HYPH|nr:manganese efflux pump [Methylocystis iwaonis]BDV34604.1 sporulation membrane protein YtaF [Methylocystis iwaonis]